MRCLPCREPAIKEDIMNAKWITPVVTVLGNDGNVDLAGCSRVYGDLIDNGIDGILVLGSLGEFFALPMSAKQEIVKNAIRTVNGAMQVVIGTNCMVLEESIAFSNFALQQGADAVMIIPPYYFHLPDPSVENFYDRIATSVSGPIYMYNYPAVMGYDLKADIVLKMALKHENIVGLKDTVPNIDHTRTVLNLIKEKRPEFEVYSGFDEFLAHNLLSGGQGCMGGTANFAPEIAAGFVRAARAEDLTEIAAYQKKIDSLMPIYTIGEQFAPIIKKAMALRGIIDCDRCTEPLLSATSEESDKIKRLLTDTGLETF